MTYKFLIYISYSYALPVGEPLEKEILSRGHSVYWFSDRKEGGAALRDKDNKLTDVKSIMRYAPDIVLTIANTVPDFIPGLKVQIFHGFNAEKRPSPKDGYSHFRIRGFFDLYCTQGPSTTKGFRRQQEKMPHFEVVETGWPKVDPLFPLENKPLANPPTIVVASTFTKELSLAYNNAIFQEIKRLSLQGNYHFMMILHPKIPKAVKDKWESLENENFSFYNTTNLIPLFKKADIMFADTTSAIQEFGLQNRPIVTFDHTFPKPYLINITSVDEIEPAFKKALKHPRNVIDSLAEYNRKLHPYTDGKSSERVINSCVNFIHKNKSHLQKKPLNLIRKFKIRKQLGYFTLKSNRKPFSPVKSPKRK